jgi:hypothetical protein
MKTRTTQFIRTHKVPNQNNETTDLIAALSEGASYRLTERATLDLHDLLQNNVDGVEFDEDVLEDQNIEVGFELDSVCGSIRTIEEIMTDLCELASEPSAEQLIADFYRTPKFNPVVATFGKVRRPR